ncbi:hypothetical protein LO772_35645 [Yinghuangia sp. ASG 101]|uniref:hypothetical protein n=1 Tax=Yinghuangia sp. ASG 101 TaxID=2896848 RepID=UPI001E3354F7|nr:hypothetical protein [Yinghuangia sp. ASG 101]UGQ12026.1 hypothetical protein LO772_35645 [Yinghuangia sp. ASG 101]
MRTSLGWQDHVLVPLGYDVHPMPEIAAFQGGNKGCTFTADQRAHYLRTLDNRDRFPRRPGLARAPGGSCW